MRRRKLLAGLFVLAGLLILAWGALHRVSGGHVVDYVIWRWMVAFKQPVQRVDDYRVVVTKSDRQLEVFWQDELVATYPVALSRHGLAPRKVWEDSLTPEGEFLIASMQYRSVFGPRQMLLDTTEQALRDYEVQYGEEGLARIVAWEAQHGPLDTIWEVYDFNAVHAEHKLWYDILIHGGQADQDWTLGCIALYNDDVVALFDILHQSKRRGLGVPVEIRP